MLLGKLKNLTVVLLTVGFLSVGGGGVAYQVVRGGQATDKPGKAVRVDQPPKGGLPADKDFRQVTERLDRVQAEQEALLKRLAFLEQELKQRPPKKGVEIGESKDVLKFFSVIGLDRDEANLRQLVMQTNEPNSWVLFAKGGHGVIQYLPEGRCLVVKNSPEIVAQVGKLLDQMQDQRNKVERVREMASKFLAVQKVYPVADLVGDGDALAQVIMSTIEPQTWRTVDGFGLISYFPDGKSLVIVQSPEIHAKIVALLADLRAAKAEQEKKK